MRVAMRLLFRAIPAGSFLELSGSTRQVAAAIPSKHNPNNLLTASCTHSPPRPQHLSSPVFQTCPSLCFIRKASDYAKQARDLNQKGLDEQESQLEDAIEQEKEKQVRAPWHREGSDQPPVKRNRSASAMTKGKLLTTPSRLLKLILPLTTLDRNTDRKDIEPLALLVHPQQPLSYLERLIQSELPAIKMKDGAEKVPNVSFRAQEAMQDEIKPRTKTAEEVEKDQKEAQEPDEASEEDDSSKSVRPGEGGVESYSGAGRESTSDDGNAPFVRWSSSTEIGDFIRDAARAKEFKVEIEGTGNVIGVAVPSFNDRTYYLRMRLRKTSKKMKDMAGVKKECDIAAHKGAQRVALAGFGIMAGWWYLVYRLTFETDLGWDTMEPVTYLVGLSTLMGGYLWFLYHNREVSYRSALNLTISRRQTKLYQQRGFDISKWEALVEEGNALRKEIKAVAREYDVDWDERADEQDKEVTKALKEERDSQKKGSKKKSKDKDDDDDDDDE